MSKVWLAAASAAGLVWSSPAFAQAPQHANAPTTPAAAATAKDATPASPNGKAPVPPTKDTPDTGAPAAPAQPAAGPVTTGRTGAPAEPINEPSAAPEPSLPATGAPSGLGPIGLWPAQSSAASAAPPTSPVPTATKSNEEILAEDWWSHTRPIFEIHGYFRTRAELFHNFSLGRTDGVIWPQPTDNTYTVTSSAGQSGGGVGPDLCTPQESGNGSHDNPASTTYPLQGCKNKTQAGANLRFRLDPELHISDNLRIVSQIDLLDNVVLGSTPGGYSYAPAPGGGYQVNAANGYYLNGVNADTAVPPTAGVNSLQNSIAVQRVWAEYTTPVGELRFGRMPDQFGLGMVHNAGDGIDDDYQSTIDRLQFITSIKPLDLYIGGSWDFPDEGYIVTSPFPGGQPYDAGQLDDVNQWSLLVMRKMSPELVKNALAHDEVVVNAGGYLTLRKQLLADDQAASATATNAGNVPNATSAEIADSYARRNANIWTPDLWLQLRYKGFRFEAEGAAVLGSIDSDDNTPHTTPESYLNAGRTIREYGVATELEQRLVEDKLRLGFNFGWASGDSSAFNVDQNPNNLVPSAAGQEPVDSKTISTFRFNPAYRIDLILNRNLLQRIQGTYYFKPSVEYDFMRKPSGQRLGGGAGVIWTRASEFVQTPGHARDLGIELDGRLYFQSKDGGLNDKPGRAGGFFAMLEYGVLFPLAGLGYQEAEKNALGGADVSAAQILRLYLGVLF